MVLINVRLPGVCGFECAQTLKKLMPKLVVVMFTDQPELTSFIRAYQAGGDGYFVFPCAAESFHETLSNALGGWKPFSKEIQKLLIERLVHTSALADTKAALTPAEQRIMAYLSLGLSDKEIAVLAGIATATVHTITSRIYKKFGAHSRREAVGMNLGLKHRTPPAAQP